MDLELESLALLGKFYGEAIGEGDSLQVDTLGSFFYMMIFFLVCPVVVDIGGPL